MELLGGGGQSLLSALEGVVPVPGAQERGRRTPTRWRRKGPGPRRDSGTEGRSRPFPTCSCTVHTRSGESCKEPALGSFLTIQPTNPVLPLLSAQGQASGRGAALLRSYPARKPIVPNHFEFSATSPPKFDQVTKMIRKDEPTGIKTEASGKEEQWRPSALRDPQTGRREPAVEQKPGGETQADGWRGLGGEMLLAELTSA